MDGDCAETRGREEHCRKGIDDRRESTRRADSKNDGERGKEKRTSTESCNSHGYRSRCPTTIGQRPPGPEHAPSRMHSTPGRDGAGRRIPERPRGSVLCGGPFGRRSWPARARSLSVEAFRRPFGELRRALGPCEAIERSPAGSGACSGTRYPCARRRRVRLGVARRARRSVLAGWLPAHRGARAGEPSALPRAPSASGLRAAAARGDPRAASPGRGGRRGASVG